MTTTEFIKSETKKLARILFRGSDSYSNLNNLKERINKESLNYVSIDDIKLFLLTLKVELSEVFGSHLKICHDKSACPKVKTFDNTNFIIDNELSILGKRGKLSTLLYDNDYFHNLKTVYYNKIEVISSFLAKDEFIKSEIERIREKFLENSIKILSSNSVILSQFNYSKYVKFSYDWLMSGYDWELEQILKNAKSDYLNEITQSNFEEDQFYENILGNLKRGVGYVLYRKFLISELESLKPFSARKYVNNPPKKKRSPVPQRTRALLQKEIASTCPFCPSQDVDHFEIHHIDEVPFNNDFQNLIMLCPTCHSKVTKKDISKEEVLVRKKSLQK